MVDLKLADDSYGIFAVEDARIYGGVRSSRAACLWRARSKPVTFSVVTYLHCRDWYHLTLEPHVGRTLYPVTLTVTYSTGTA